MRNKKKSSLAVLALLVCFNLWATQPEATCKSGPSKNGAAVRPVKPTESRTQEITINCGSQNATQSIPSPTATSSPPKHESTQDYAKLIEALASLLWPLVALTALFLFRPQIADLVKRIKKGKLFGQEIELEESLDNLSKSAEAAQTEVAALPNVPTNEKTTAAEAVEQDVVRRILSEAAQSPKAALISLASELESLAREVLAATGHLQGRRMVSAQRSIEELHQTFGLPSHVPSSLKHFWDVRNRVIHRGEGTDEDILRAIDSGIAIFRALQALPREENFVYSTSIPIYADELLSKPLEGVTGLILETHSPGGASTTFRIFPTTRTHFTVGKRVSWEWNMGLIFGEAWYRDPTSGEVRMAWGGSAEFIGRHLDEL